MCVEDGATAVFVPNVLSGLALDDSATLHSGTTAVSAAVNSGGELNVSSGGAAKDTMINSGGELNVSSGGAADDTAVNEGGGFTVNEDGTANGATVNRMGSMYVFEGGTATVIWAYVVEAAKSMTIVAHGPASGDVSKYDSAAGLGRGRVF